MLDHSGPNGVEADPGAIPLKLESPPGIVGGLHVGGDATEALPDGQLGLDEVGEVFGESLAEADLAVYYMEAVGDEMTLADVEDPADRSGGGNL